MKGVYKHELALCESSEVGAGTRIHAFAHVLPGARIGVDCNICDGVFIENDVVVGNRVTVKCGVQLWDGVTIEDDVFIGPNATFTNDPFPRSRIYPTQFARTLVRNGASVGANATILPGLEVGAGAMIGAGAVVTRSVPSNAIVTGSPARIVGYIDAKPTQDHFTVAPVEDDSSVSVTPTGVRGVSLYKFPRLKDMRGALTVGEVGRDLPFKPSRYFFVFEVPTREVRGEHAHRRCHQFLIAAHGSLSVLVDDGTTRREILLDNPAVGLHIPPMIWGTQWNYTSDAVLLVFASEPYQAQDYIRHYNEFLEALRRAEP